MRNSNISWINKDDLEVYIDYKQINEQKMIPLHYVTDLNKVNNQKKVFFAISRFFFYFQGWQVCLRQIATAAFNLRTWDSDIRIGIISSVTESKKKCVRLTV